VGVGVEITPCSWHTVIALTSGAILLEVKEGPFNPDFAKEYAYWAPVEGCADGDFYLQFLRELCQ